MFSYSATELTTAFSATGRMLDRINQDVCAFDKNVELVPFGGMSDLPGRPR